jgi:homoserine kinase type II
MAVKTRFSAVEFEQILTGYNLGRLVCASPISNGTVQTNYLLTTTTGRFVFRYYENRSKESVLFEIELLNRLVDRKYPCPTPISSKNGQFLGVCCEKPYVIFSFVEGEHIENPSNEQTDQLIRKVAELHNITSGFQPEMTPYRLNYNVEQCKRLAQEQAKKIDTSNASGKLEWYIHQIDRLILPESMPMGVCHCDFHFSNVLYLNGDFYCLLDFDDANYTFLVFDLINLLEPFKDTFDWVTWHNFGRYENVFDFSKARRVVSEYKKVRPLHQVEKEHLFDVLKLGILIDCIWYFERGDVNDFFEKRKIDSLNQLGRDRFYQELFNVKSYV